LLKTTEKLINIPNIQTIQGLKAKKKEIYGMELILELFGCDMEAITSKEKIEEFIEKVCEEIKMERYGRPMIKRFPGGKLWGVGYSFLQFLTTSSIAGHFIDEGAIAFINIFSCKEYDAERATRFTENFFKPKKINPKLIVH
jgi:S-adenosylmethionine/arginine decarboxylase-like enzyme